MAEPGAELLNMDGERFVLSPTGPLDRCEDDVRRFFDAAEVGIKRALKAGASKPLLVVIPDENMEQSLMVAVLGAMHALYTNLEHRESRPEKASFFYLKGKLTISRASVPI